MRVTIKDIMTTLNTQFPNTTFENGRRHWRGQNKDWLSWDGGPNETQVQQICDNIMPGRIKHYSRTPTDAEMAEMDRQDEAARAAWEAGKPRRKAIGAAKRAKTLALKRTWQATIEHAYPDLMFTVKSEQGVLTVQWIDGPSRDTMSNLLNITPTWNQLRQYDSPAVKARKALESKFYHKLMQRRTRDIKIAKGIARHAKLAIQRAKQDNQYKLDL